MESHAPYLYSVLYGFKVFYQITYTSETNIYVLYGFLGALVNRLLLYRSIFMFLIEFKCFIIDDFSFTEIYSCSAYI